MEDKFTSLLTALSDYVETATDARPPLSCFKPATEGRLGLSAFIRGDAPTAAVALNQNCLHCHWENVPVLEAVTEKNGWLLFSFSSEFWNALLRLGQTLPPASAETYWGNRLHILTRKGDAPCPVEPRVQEVLLLTFWAWGTGRYPKDLPQKLLTMTHVSPPAYRLTLENQCGAVAKALLGFMGKC